MKLILKDDLLVISHKNLEIELLKILDFKKDAFLELNYNNSLMKCKKELERLKYLNLVGFKKDTDYSYLLRFENKDIQDESVFKKLTILSNNFNNFIISID